MVSPIAVFDGLIIAIAASLRIGIETALAPELNDPIHAIAPSSRAARRAFAATRSGTQLPARAVASLSVTSRTARPPAIPPASCSAWRAPSLTARVWPRAAPLSGRLE